MLEIEQSLKHCILSYTNRMRKYFEFWNLENKNETCI